MNAYIASFVNKKEECWDMYFYAKNLKDAKKEAKSLQKTMGKLYAVRRFKGQ